MFNIRYALIVIGLTGLVGCQSSPIMQSFAGVGQAMVFRSSTEKKPPSLNPAFQYLRVQSGKRVAYFARGSIDRQPGGDVDVWYSGLREVLRLQNGRVVGESGMSTEWLAVVLQSPPNWDEDLNGVEYARIRDIAPGYRYGLKDKLRLQLVQPPSSSHLVGIRPQDLIWYRETSITDTDTPPALYGLSKEQGRWQVVYSEVCMATDLCFSWQRWQA